LSEISFAVKTGEKHDFRPLIITFEVIVGKTESESESEYLLSLGEYIQKQIECQKIELQTELKSYQIEAQENFVSSAKVATLLLVIMIIIFIGSLIVQTIKISKEKKFCAERELKYQQAKAEKAEQTSKQAIEQAVRDAELAEIRKTNIFTNMSWIQNQTTGEIAYLVNYSGAEVLTRPYPHGKSLSYTQEQLDRNFKMVEVIPFPWEEILRRKDEKLVCKSDGKVYDMDIIINGDITLQDAVNQFLLTDGSPFGNPNFKKTVTVTQHKSALTLENNIDSEYQKRVKEEFNAVQQANKERKLREEKRQRELELSRIRPDHIAEMSKTK
jgi:hypothetical protein